MNITCKNTLLHICVNFIILTLPKTMAACNVVDVLSTCPTERMCTLYNNTGIYSGCINNTVPFMSNTSTPIPDGVYIEGHKISSGLLAFLFCLLAIVIIGIIIAIGNALHQHLRHVRHKQFQNPASSKCITKENDEEHIEMQETEGSPRCAESPDLENSTV